MGYNDKEFDWLMVTLKEQCWRNAGKEFEWKLDPVYYSEYYVVEKSLLFKEWKLRSTSGQDDLDKLKKRLAHLPKGITYRLQKEVISDDVTNAKERLYNSGSIYYMYTGFISVSAAFSQKEWAEAKDKKVLTPQNFPSRFVSNAESFKNRIFAKHSDILETLYDAFKRGFCRIDSNGLTDGEDGCSFVRLNLKPLENDYEIFGLALAFAEYASKQLASNEKILIKGDDNYKHFMGYRNFHIKVIECVAKPSLQEW